MKKLIVILTLAFSTHALIGCGDTINNYYGENGQIKGEQAFIESDIQECYVEENLPEPMIEGLEEVNCTLLDANNIKTTGYGNTSVGE